MAAGAIGTCWATGSWADTAWEAGSWANAGVSAPALIGWIAAPGGRYWVAGVGEMGALVRSTIEKTAGDAVRLRMDFGDIPEIESGAKIASCTVSVSPSGPTVVTPASINTAGYLASTKVSGGTAGTDYEVTFTATLDDADGTVISRAGTLQVR